MLQNDVFQNKSSLPGALPVQSREARYDNMKALLIFLVVLGHSLFRFAITDPFGIFLYIFIYSFHMPAFVFLLGKFAKPSLKRMVRFAVIYLALQVVLTIFLKYVCNDDVELSFITPQWIAWYLLAVIAYTSLAFLLPKELSSGKKVMFFVGSCVMAIVVGFIPFVGEEFALSRIVVFLPFFLAGRFGSFDRPTKRAVPIFSLVFAVLLLFAYISISAGDLDALYMRSGYAESNSTWFLRLIVLTAAFGFIRFLIYIIPNKNIPILTDIGKRTLFIFLSHGFIIRLVECFYLPHLSVLFSVVFSFVVLALCWGTAVLFDKIKQKYIKN